MIKKFTIINRDPIAITFFLRAMGKTRFLNRMKSSLQEYPRFNELFFEFDFNSCWLMKKGQYKDYVLFQLKNEEIPLYGWQITAQMKRRKKIK